MRKKTPSTKLLWLALAAVCAFSVACNRNPATETGDVLASVNGTPITEMDVLFALRNAGQHQKEVPAETKKTVLENLIKQELGRQRAVELGLDTDPAYRKELQSMEAQMNAFKRQNLAELFLQREIIQKARISDAEAQQYFTENAARLRREIHVWQILSRKEAVIEKVRDEIAQGSAFDEVAEKLFPSLPNTSRKPWDLGYLRWNQIPEAWQKILDGLNSGETSNIIRGPSNRFWIIKLIDKRENPDITFEQIKPTLTDFLNNEKAWQLRKETVKQLRDKARVVYSESLSGSN